MADGLDRSQKNTILIATIATAAAVSAATAAYIVWRKTQASRDSAESVQYLLDKAHRTLTTLEEKFGKLQDDIASTTLA